MKFGIIYSYDDCWLADDTHDSRVGEARVGNDVTDKRLVQSGLTLVYQF